MTHDELPPLSAEELAELRRLAEASLRQSEEDETDWFSTEGDGPVLAFVPEDAAFIALEWAVREEEPSPYRDDVEAIIAELRAHRQREPQVRALVEFAVAAATVWCGGCPVDCADERGYMSEEACRRRHLAAVGLEPESAGQEEQP